MAAVAPIRILQLDRDGLADVTRGFPGEVRKDLRALRKDYPSFVRQKAPLKGILAAIAADTILLNDEKGTARTFQRIEMIYGREFGKRLRLFLARRGYRLQIGVRRARATDSPGAASPRHEDLTRGRQLRRGACGRLACPSRRSAPWRSPSWRRPAPLRSPCRGSRTACWRYGP